MWQSSRLTSRLSLPIAVAGIGGGTRWRTSLPEGEHGGSSPCRSGKRSWCKQNERCTGCSRAVGTANRREGAQDPALLTEPAYGDHVAGEDVPYPILLALRRDGHYLVFDGVQRAVQLIRNGETTLGLCVGELA